MTRARITDFRPQSRNANRHTQRGMRALEESIQRDGWIGAVTVAADGEAIAGSARTETAVAIGMEEVIIVETDGTKPVILKRTDIPSAEDPRAKRLAISDNRVGELNLDWVPQMLDELKEEDALPAGQFRDDELARIFEQERQREARTEGAFEPNRAPSILIPQVTPEALEKARQILQDRITRAQELKQVVCPACAYEFFLDPADVQQHMDKYEREHQAASPGEQRKDDELFTQ